MTLPFRPRRPTAASDTPATPAFDELFLAHYAGLCQFAYRLTGSRMVAEDIVQDLFLALWSRPEPLTLDDPLPYLYASVRNRAISHGRRERWRFLTLTRRAEELPSIQPPDAAGAETGELARAVEQAIRGLPERRREIFVLHREQHLTYAQIAATLGISVKTVETQMGRALKALRERLAPLLLLLLALAGVLSGPGGPLP